MISYPVSGNSLLSLVLFAAVIFGHPAPSSAQDKALEAGLKGYFEGKRVTLKMDMPATSSGVDVFPGTERPVNYKDYGERLKVAGISLAAGDSSTITLVKMKKDLIEFQIGGGGFGNDTGYVAPDYVGKSNREKQLEKDVKAETDPARKKRLQRELDDERNDRMRTERSNRAAAQAEQAANKARIAQERLHAGSRFNLRYAKAVPSTLTADDVIAALSAYVDFNVEPRGNAPQAGKPMPFSPAPAAAPAAPSLPRKGMSRSEAERAFGTPTESSARSEGGLRLTTLVFLHGDQRISADFVEDILIRYTVSSR